MKSQPLVSVVIPTYKRISCLQNAISSAVNQTYENIEIIVVNDDPRSDIKEILK
ncbi:MAG: glycosyltransferase, partial [Nanoarchaeota archaeon]|nr:glycosyltransferase [Nanoarchaeota archaeon]